MGRRRADRAASCGERLLQHGQIADVVREQQHEARVELLALLVAEFAVGIDQRLVEIVGRVEVRCGDQHRG
jgi:hypothetical protein